MRRTNIYLEEDQLQALKHLAAQQDQSLAAVVRDAVDIYVTERIIDDAAWSERLEQLLKSVQSRIPSDITPEQIEADITAESEELRRERIAARGR